MLEGGGRVWTTTPIVPHTSPWSDLRAILAPHSAVPLVPPAVAAYISRPPTRTKRAWSTWAMVDLTVHAFVSSGVGGVGRGHFVHDDFLQAARVAFSTLSSLSKARRIIVVWYLPVAPPKRLPSTPGDRLTCVHVNSGVTFIPARPTTSTTHILIYRRQDACKVMMHELVHAMGVDTAWREEPHASVDAGHGFNESYVDAIACYMHALWSAHRCDPRGTSGYAVATTRETILDVAARVQHHFRRHTWSESTHAYSYYVCKAALWYDLPAFLATTRGNVTRPDVSRFHAFLAVALSCPAFEAEMMTRRARLSLAAVVDVSKSLRMAPPHRDLCRQRRRRQ